MASSSLVSTSSWLSNRTTHLSTPTASLSLLTRRTVSSRNAAVSSGSASARSCLLHCSFLPSVSSALSFPFSVSGLSLGLSFKTGNGRNNKRSGYVVCAGRAALCLTKRSRSRKSLARTHGFRVRMSTTSGRAVLKRRRAKGRKILCTKTNPNSGKRS